MASFFKNRILLFSSNFRFTEKLREKYWKFSSIPCLHMHSFPHYQHLIILINETMIHHHPKSIVYIRVQSWCCIFYVFWQMHNDIHPSLSYCTVYFHQLTSPLCSTCPSPLPSTTSDLFTVYTVLPLPEHRKVRIIQYVTFSDWLFSLSNINLRFFHVFSWLDGSFHFSTE